MQKYKEEVMFKYKVHEDVFVKLDGLDNYKCKLIYDRFQEEVDGEIINFYIISWAGVGVKVKESQIMSWEEYNEQKKI
jgi:hypothetical protein